MKLCKWRDILKALRTIGKVLSDEKNGDISEKEEMADVKKEEKVSADKEEGKRNVDFNNSGLYNSGDGNVINQGNTYTYNSVPPIEKKYSDVKIVDISIREDIVDVKLRNVGNQVAFIKEITFNVFDFYAMEDICQTSYSLAPVTCTYDLLLSELKKQTFKVSQYINGNDVDHFQLKIASSDVLPLMAAIYYLSLSIVYDEDNKTVESGKFVWAVRSFREFYGCYRGGKNIWAAKKNYENLLRFDRYDADKSKWFKGILESYEKNKNDFL